jgi:hypothetical protein
MICSSTAPSLSWWTSNRGCAASFDTGGEILDWPRSSPNLVRHQTTGTRTMNFTDLPAVNAGLNSLSTLLLLAGFIFIKRGNKLAHQKCMIGALVTSTSFWCVT